MQVEFLGKFHNQEMLLKVKQIKRKKVISNYVSGLAIQAGIFVTAIIVVISAK